MKNIVFTDTTQRKQQQNIDFDPIVILQQIQEGVSNETTDACLREIKKKHSSYKSQDKLKHKYDITKHITLSQLMDKLKDSQLKCYYCSQKMMLLYNKKKEQSQWTLERLNNNLGHYHDNTCISCLKCNLGRRTDNHEYYKKGKTMILEKVI
jgi:hypothetical protein